MADINPANTVVLSMDFQNDIVAGMVPVEPGVLARAAQVLARPGSRVMALIGNGAQSEFQALAFHHLLGIRELRLFDIDAAATAKLQRNLAGVPGLRLTGLASCAGCAANSQLHPGSPANETAPERTGAAAAGAGSAGWEPDGPGPGRPEGPRSAAVDETMQPLTSPPNRLLKKDVCRLPQPPAPVKQFVYESCSSNISRIFSGPCPAVRFFRTASFLGLRPDSAAGQEAERRNSQTDQESKYK